MKKPKPDACASMEEVISRMGVDPRTLRKWLEAGLPSEGGRGQKRLIKLWDLALWLYKSGVPQEQIEALERYRTAKAVEAERKNAVEQGKLLDADAVRREVRAIAHGLRAQLDVLTRGHPEMAEELRGSLELAAKQASEKFGGVE